MKLLPTQTDNLALATLGEEARDLLIRHDFSELANRFGYALAYDRILSTAIEADFLIAVASAFTTASDVNLSPSVKYFAPNDTGLFAVVECLVPVANGSAVLLALIVTSKGEERHITLEDISGE